MVKPNVKPRSSKSNRSIKITTSSYDYVGSPAMRINYNEARHTNGSTSAANECKTANEYANAVRQWMWQYQMWNQMNWLYMTMPMYASCMPGIWPGQQLPPGVCMPGSMGPQELRPNGVPPQQTTRQQSQRTRSRSRLCL